MHLACVYICLIMFWYLHSDRGVKVNNRVINNQLFTLGVITCDIITVIGYIEDDFLPYFNKLCQVKLRFLCISSTYSHKICIW